MFWQPTRGILQPNQHWRRPQGGYANAEAAAVAAAFTTPPDGAHASAIDTLVGSLKSAGTWTKMDVLYLLAAADSQAARINWKNPGTNTLTVSGSPTFAADSGYSSDGSTGYLDVGTAYGGFAQLVQDSAHLGAYTGGTLAGSGFWFPWGRSSGSGRYILGSSVGSTSLTARLSTNTLQTLSTSISAANAHFVATRTSSSASEGYQNGSSVGTNASVSTDIGSGNAWILNSNGTFSDSGFIARCVHFGSQLSATEVSDTYNAIHTYMQVIAGVA